MVAQMLFYVLHPAKLQQMNIQHNICRIYLCSKIVTNGFFHLVQLIWAKSDLIATNGTPVKGAGE